MCMRTAHHREVMHIGPPQITHILSVTTSQPPVVVAYPGSPHRPQHGLSYAVAHPGHRRRPGSRFGGCPRTAPAAARSGPCIDHVKAANTFGVGGNVSGAGRHEPETNSIDASYPIDGCGSGWPVLL